MSYPIVRRLQGTRATVLMDGSPRHRKDGRLSMDWPFYHITWDYSFVQEHGWSDDPSFFEIEYFDRHLTVTSYLLPYWGA